MRRMMVAAFATTMASASAPAAADTITLTLAGPVQTATAAGGYTGVIDLFGGPTDGSNTLIAERTFAVNVATGAVPAPASWALMIAGVGAVGTFARRRRMRVAFA